MGPGSESPSKQASTHYEGDEDELELRYDPLLNCYFDPVTNKYYELA